jgi:hypothetical protein
LSQISHISTIDPTKSMVSDDVPSPALVPAAWCTRPDWGLLFRPPQHPPTTRGEFVMLMFMYVYRCLIMLPLTGLLWLLYRTWTNLSMDLRENRPETLFSYLKRTGFLQIFEKITGIVRWSCNRTHAGWAFRLMVSSYGCSPTLMAWTQPNYAPYTKPHAEIDFFTEIAATQFIPILLTKKNWAQRNLQPSQRPQNRIPLGSPVIKHGWWIPLSFWLRDFHAIASWYQGAIAAHCWPGTQLQQHVETGHWTMQIFRNIRNII